MPTYDYVCGSCGHELEVFQSMNEPKKRKCPACGTLKLQRRIGIGAGVLFKGSGFYETDYRSSSYQAGVKADTEAAKPKPEASGESKAKGGKKAAKEAKS